jgi:outer membrane protein TolC
LAHAGPVSAQANARSAADSATALAAYDQQSFLPLKGAIPLAEAVRRALSANANVVLQQLQVRAEEGNVQQSRGAYDLEGVGALAREHAERPLRNSEIAAGAAGRAEYTNSTNYRAGVSRLLESGSQVELALTGSAIASSLTPPQQNAAALRFGIRVPLLRNVGGIQQSTALKARELERDASVEDFVQTSANTVIGVAQAYWELASRIRRIEILKASEGRAEGLVAEISKLVAADQIPGAELDLAQASAAEKRAARFAEEQAFQIAWNGLGRLLQADTGEATVEGLATDPLPAIDQQAFALAETALQRRQAAPDRRADVRAARLRERAAYLQRLAAENGLRPQVDMVVAATTNGLAEGASAMALGAALGLGRPLPGLSVGVEWRVPFDNNAARGLLLSQESAHNRSIVRMRDAERSVGPLVVTAANTLRRIAQRHGDTLAAADRYAVAVKNEYVKRRLGLSTLIDVITVQDRLDSAQLLLLQLRQEYAVAIAQLLFENGDLIRRDGDAYRVDMPILTGAQPARATQ